MMTRSDFRMPHCAVWLLLVAILCVAVLPSVASAKLIEKIATEGDPTDGHDSTGGGGSWIGSGLEIDKDKDIAESNLVNRKSDSPIILELLPMVPIWVNGHIVFSLNAGSYFYWKVWQ